MNNQLDQYKHLESQGRENYPTTVVIKMPCCTGYSVQIPKPRDHIITCPKCGRKAMFTWSKTGKHKIKWEK